MSHAYKVSISEDLESIICRGEVCCTNTFELHDLGLHLILRLFIKVIHHVLEKNVLLPPAFSLHVCSHLCNHIYGVCFLSLKINETAGDFLFDKLCGCCCVVP